MKSFLCVLRNSQNLGLQQWAGVESAAGRERLERGRALGEAPDFPARSGQTPVLHPCLGVQWDYQNDPGLQPHSYICTVGDGFGKIK